jgi:hypothetical protein
MNRRHVFSLLLPAILLSASQAQAQYYGPGNGTIKGPDGKYYPLHKLGESYRNATKLPARPTLPRAVRIYPAAPTAPRGLAAGEHFASNLGVYYTLVSLPNGLGARLTRLAQPGTPASALGLERGDTIVALDDLPIRKPADVLAHVDRTTVRYINVRTGKVQMGVVQLPGQARR